MRAQACLFTLVPSFAGGHHEAKNGLSWLLKPVRLSSERDAMLLGFSICFCEKLKATYFIMSTSCWLSGCKFEMIFRDDHTPLRVNSNST